MKSNLTLSGRGNWVSYQTGQKSHILPNCSVIISGQSTLDTISDMELGMTQYALSVSVCTYIYIRIYSKVEDYETENKRSVDTEYE